MSEKTREQCIEDGEVYPKDFEKFIGRPNDQPDPMKEWIEELEGNFKFNNHTQGDLIEYGHDGSENILYQVPSEGILINRIVTVDQLEALARHIRKNQKK